MIKFEEVKAGDFIGLKTYNNVNTGNNFDTVIWWSVDGSGKHTRQVKEKWYKEERKRKKTILYIK